MVLLVFRLLVCLLWFCMRCLRSDQFEFMVLIVVSMVLTCGVSQMLFFDSCGCFQFFCNIFPVTTRERVLFSGAYLPVGWCFDTQWLRISHSKGSNRLGVSWLKMAAELACETKFLCFKVSVRRWKKSKTRRSCQYVVHCLQSLIVLKFFKLCTGNTKTSSVSTTLPVSVAARSRV
jgi:hypothetical protein